MDFMRNNSTTSEATYLNVSLLVKCVMIGTALILTFLTSAVFLINRKLWKQHNIFQMNVVFADAISVIVFAVYFGRSLNYIQYPVLYAIAATPLGVSLGNIMLVAIYRYINIVMDPFGKRSILTTPRCIIVSISTWITSSCTAATITQNFTRVECVILASIALYANLLITGLLYVIIYRAVSKSTDHTEQRLNENKRILKTFVMVYATTLIFEGTAGAMGLVYLSTVAGLNDIPGYAYFLIENLFIICAISNSLIYWWRLKEFRSIITLFKCRRPFIQPM